MRIVLLGVKVLFLLDVLVEFFHLLSQLLINLSLKVINALRNEDAPSLGSCLWLRDE